MYLPIIFVAGFLMLTACSVPRGSGEPLEAKNSTNVPFVLEDNRAFIEVKINGQGPFHLLLDTGGGPGVLIEPAVAKAISLKTDGTDELSGAGAEKETALTGIAESAQIGSIRLSNLKAMVLSLAKLRRAIGFQRMDGIIGEEVFSRFVTTYDFQLQQLIFTKPSDFKKPVDALVFPLEIDDGAPFILAKIGDVEGKFLVDTGDRSYLSFCGPFAKKFDLLSQVNPVIEAMSGFGVGGPIPAKVGRVAKLQIGGLTIKDVIARFPTLTTGAFGSTDVAGIIGNGILKKFTTIFDYSRSEMMLVPNEASDQRDSYDRAGLWIGVGEDGSRVVYDVVAGGPAFEAGVRVLI